MFELLPPLKQRFFDNNGAPLAGGMLYSYQAGTTIPQATYTDETGATPNANPTVLDSSGQANIWINPNTPAYKFMLTDSAGNALWTVDNVSLNDLANGVQAINGLSGALTLDMILPTQTGNAGKLLGTNGTTSSWQASGATPVAGSVVARDTNANAEINNLIENYATTVTAAGTTTLTVASAYLQYFTGTTTQTIVLPVASTLLVGQQFLICNRSTGALTVNSSGSNSVQTVNAGSQTIVTCILASGTTAASWDISAASGAVNLTGDVTSVGAATTYNNALPVAKGGTGVVAAGATSVASSAMTRDANKNTQINNLIEGYTTTATAAGTTTLTVASTFEQYFTGTNKQTVALPVTSTLVLGQQFLIVNRSTGILTVQSSGANTIQVMAKNTQLLVTCILTSGTSAASWDATYSPSSIGISSGGAKNYLTTYLGNPGNGDFESNTTTGWSLFNTTITSSLPGTINAGASSIPIFTSSGSGSTPAQIGGNYSLNVASIASITGGQGFISDPFTIDTEDQSRVLGFKFNYFVFSGASNMDFSGSVNNSWAVFIRDVTNSVWIQPAGVYGMTQKTGAGVCSGTFQTSSNGTQYRIAVVCLNGTAGACSIVYDDFVIGPQTIPQGYAGSDWIPYTPATLVGFGSYTQGVFAWRRVGDSMEIMGQLLAGTATGSATQVQLPGGYQIEGSGTKVSNVSHQIVGITGQDLQATPCFVIALGGDNSLYFGYFSSSSTASIPQAVVVSNHYMFWQATVPIQGWSSNVQLSQDTDTRIVAIKVGMASAKSITSGQVVTFDTTSYDTHAGFNGTTGIYTIPVSGIYRVAFTSNCTPNSNFYVIQNGTGVGYIGTANSSIIGAGALSLLCKAGDQIALEPDTSTLVQGSSGGGFTSTLSIERVSGPSVVAATESVNASYGLLTTTSPGSLAPLKYDTRFFDSHNGYSIATGIYTFPVSGKYRISSNIQSPSSTTGWRLIGTVKGFSFSRYIGQAITNFVVSCSLTLDVNAGDSIGFCPDSSISCNGTSDFLCQFSLERVGN